MRPQEPLSHLDEGPEGQGADPCQAANDEAKKEKENFLSSIREMHLIPA